MDTEYDLSLSIVTSNLSELSECLRRVSMRIAHGDLHGNILDINGNTVGSFDVETED